MNLALRPAHHTDVAAIFDFLVAMHAEIAGTAPINPAKARAGILDCIENGGAWVVFDGDELVGSLGVYRFDEWYSDEPIIGSLWFYVPPLYRHTEAAELLMREARELSLAVGLKVLLHLPLKRHRRNSATAALAEQLEFTPGAAVVEVGHVP